LHATVKAITYDKSFCGGAVAGTSWIMSWWRRRMLMRGIDNGPNISLAK